MTIEITQPTTPLQSLQPGASGFVRRLAGEQNFIQRLSALGFTLGAPVTVLRSSGNGPMLVSIRNTQIAIGHEEAGNILVSLDDHSGNLIENSPQVKVTIALAGQPNVGKSTIFNSLTGLNQHVGNWTGKTVELKSGDFSHASTSYTIVDLPGTYSLTANSDEERITRDFILKENPGLVIAVVDAATLERNLYLISELLLLPAPVILALNMMDVAVREGFKIEPKVLQTALGIPVVPMAASQGQGQAELLAAVNQMAAGTFEYSPNKPTILPSHQKILDEVGHLIASYVPSVYPVEWVALKLLEGDSEITLVMQEAMPEVEWQKVHALLYEHEDAILDIAGARYEWIARMIRVAVVEPPITRVGLTAKLDKVLTHPLWGTIILAGILGLVFFLTYTVGSPLQSLLSRGVAWLAALVRTSLTNFPSFIVEFLAGGILGGLGMVLTFLPILAIFFLALGLLEDTGYLARAAYLTDRWMHRMGLHGKSFLPLLLGFGCNVPAVLGTRIIESRRARLLTILLIPLIPCTARMAVVAVLAPLFFGSAMATWITWGLIAGNILLLAGIGQLLHRFAFNDEHVSFIMELPLYHMPNLRTIGMYIWQNIAGFLEKAGKIILGASLVVWAFSYFPNGQISTSWLASFGKFIQPIGSLMGLPWPALVALLTSVVAKENTIATLGILYGNLSTNLSGLLGNPASIAMLVFQMLFVPCVATIAAIRQESKSLKWTVISILIMLALSFTFAVLVFQVGRWLSPGG